MEDTVITISEGAIARPISDEIAEENEFSQRASDPHFSVQTFVDKRPSGWTATCILGPKTRDDRDIPRGVCLTVSGPSRQQVSSVLHRAVVG